MPQEADRPLQGRKDPRVPCDTRQPEILICEQGMKISLVL